MPESFNEHKIYSLFEITQSVQRAFQKWYPGTFWIVAEMNKLNHYPHSGHCYPDLVERKDGKVVAQIRANIWADDYIKINKHFLDVLKEPLKEGVNILFLAKISFHPLYGISLHISYIDPSYTLGELEKEKQETIRRLKAEELFDRNKSLSLPVLPQRIAIISVETSKGYSDFMNIINANGYGYRFFVMLFPALLQGDNAVESITGQLNQIRRVLSHFDVVTIIRGGGGDVGLSVYNQYQLAREIAQFPIPVLTGIGHSTNETVTEMVAWKNSITPTDLANFLIQKFHLFAVPVQEAGRKLEELPKRRLVLEMKSFNDAVKYFRSGTLSVLTERKGVFKNKTGLISRIILGRIEKDRYKIENSLDLLCKYSIQAGINKKNEFRSSVVKFRKAIDDDFVIKLKSISITERQIALIHPDNILKRGFSITRSAGKVISDVDQIISPEIETTLYNGKIISRIISTEPKDE